MCIAFRSVRFIQRKPGRFNKLSIFGCSLVLFSKRNCAGLRHSPPASRQAALLGVGAEGIETSSAIGARQNRPTQLDGQAKPAGNFHSNWPPVSIRHRIQSVGVEAATPAVLPVKNGATHTGHQPCYRQRSGRATPQGNSTAHASTSRSTPGARWTGPPSPAPPPPMRAEATAAAGQGLLSLHLHPTNLNFGNGRWADQRARVRRSSQRRPDAVSHRACDRIPVEHWLRAHCSRPKTA